MLNHNFIPANHFRFFILLLVAVPVVLEDDAGTFCIFDKSRGQRLLIKLLFLHKDIPLDLHTACTASGSGIAQERS